MDEITESKFPCTYIVHTPSGPTHCCEDHARKVRTLFEFLGAHVHIELYFGDGQCGNCINEAKKKSSE